MSAERVIAWNEVLTAAGLDPHAVPDDAKRDELRQRGEAADHD